MHVSFCELWELVMDREPSRAAIHGVTKSRTSLIAQLVKNLSVVQENPVQFLGREDPLEKG